METCHIWYIQKVDIKELERVRVKLVVVLSFVMVCAWIAARESTATVHGSRESRNNGELKSGYLTRSTRRWVDCWCCEGVTSCKET